ncbi:CPK3 [Symbiodinium natans]|uniref:CPK3 protein n=1 Tax=Symbiodinium natans TaxID=878477 RepID=A0A812V7W8_9DINO|nr:CPK3 [Symbiodinium natans]
MGRVYYYNRATGESTWSNPALAKAEARGTKEPGVGLIPGTKDPEEPKPAPISSPAAKAAAEPKTTTAAPKRVESVSDQPELSALIVFDDAAALGFADIARELLWSSGCAILLDRPCSLDAATLRLLLGCPVRGRAKPDSIEASLQLWLDHLKGQHHVFVVRRSGAVALLLQLCFGPELRRQPRKAASHGPLSSTWPFLHLEEDLRPWPPPLFPCLQSLLSVTPPSHLGGEEPDAAEARKPISAPVVAAACHSRAHAAAVVGRLARELLQSQEVVLVMRGSADESDFRAARKALTEAPLGFVELLCTTDPAVIGQIATSSRPSMSPPVLPIAALREGLGYSESNTAAWLCDKSSDGTPQGLARVALFSRVAGACEVQAFATLLRRTARGLAAEDDGFACALFEAYKALEQKGAILVWQPYDIDLTVTSLWPDAAAPRAPEQGVARVLVDRSLRLADPDFGMGRLLGTLPEGRPRTAMATWSADVVLSCGERGEFMVADRRLRSEVLEADGESVSALAMTQRALRLLFFTCACRGQGPEPFRFSVLQFPRNLAPEDTPWATVTIRDSVPWRSLHRHPEVYQPLPRLRAVKLSMAELKALRLEGAIVGEDLAGGQVSKGWQLCPGADLPTAVPTATFAAGLLGVDSDALKSPEDSEVPQGLAQLISRSKEESATLIFDTATPSELKVKVPTKRALTADLCFQARGEQDFLAESLEVPRRAHMQTEAMLLGASLARLAIQNEVAPLEWVDAATALGQAEQVLHGCSRSLQQLYCKEMPAWLKEPAPTKRPRCRTLCNEAVGDVVEAWRLLSSESPVVDLGEYFTDQFLSLSHGSLMSTQPSSYLSAEGPLLASQVLVNYSSGALPAVRIWGVLPVLSKPGRFAAQMWNMLRLDQSLRSFGQAFPALTDGFLHCYLKEAPGGASAAAVRLRLHSVLLLLELIELRREIIRLGVKDPYTQLPTEAALRESLRQEVLQAVAAYKSQSAPSQQGAKSEVAH